MSIIMNISKTDNGGQIVVEYFKIGRARQAPGKRPGRALFVLLRALAGQIEFAGRDRPGRADNNFGYPGP